LAVTEKFKYLKPCVFDVVLTECAIENGIISSILWHIRGYLGHYFSQK
jgi:hypothetical protein